ncbi:MAG: hypothetical protein N4A54_12530 [Peptostreptococcaceae bacterium]|jgi:hypothetical protein|nr:hypothetical protein [Peptostreptococcaceae bacterium]
MEVYLIVFTIFMLGSLLYLRNDKVEKDHILIVQDYKEIGKAIELYKRIKNSLPLDLISLEDYIKDLNYKPKYYELTSDKRGLIVKKSLANETKVFLKELFKDKFLKNKDNVVLYYKEYMNLKEPKAQISINPKGNIFTTTKVKLSSIKSYSKEGIIKDEEWVNKKDFYREPGEYEVKLRIKDKDGIWSEFVSKKIEVIEDISYKRIFLKDEQLYILKNNGNIHMLLPDSNEKYDLRLVKKIENIKSISFGEKHILYLNYNGDVYIYGKNNHGQLGNGNNVDVYDIQKLKTINRVKNIYAGKDFNCIKTMNGDLYSFGCNTYGQLGDGTNANREKPTIVEDLKNIIDVSLGDGHTLAVDIKGNLFGFGCNTYGQLGDGSKINKFRPILIAVENVIKIACAKDYSIVLNSKGMLFGFGNNKDYQLGVKGRSHLKPVQILGVPPIKKIYAKQSISCGISENGKVFVWGTFGKNEIIIREPEKIELAKFAKDIVINDSGIYILTTDDFIYYWDSITQSIEYIYNCKYAK